MSGGEDYEYDPDDYSHRYFSRDRDRVLVYVPPPPTTTPTTTTTTTSDLLVIKPSPVYVEADVEEEATSRSSFISRITHSDEESDLDHDRTLALLKRLLLAGISPSTSSRSVAATTKASPAKTEKVEKVEKKKRKRRGRGDTAARMKKSIGKMVKQISNIITTSSRLQKSRHQSSREGEKIEVHLKISDDADRPTGGDDDKGGDVKLDMRAEFII